MTTTSGQRKTFVLDTSVLLADPRALKRFKDVDIVIPLVVITELEGKRHHPDLGYFARKALRQLDELRVEYGSLSNLVPIGEGSTLRVEMNYVNPEILPPGFRLGDNDSRILAVAKALVHGSTVLDGDVATVEVREVTLLSRDLPMRIKASALGLATEDYKGDRVNDTGWTGVEHVYVTDEEISSLYENGTIYSDAAVDLPVNGGLIIHGSNSQALGRLNSHKEIQLVKGDRDVFGLHGRSAEQRIAMDLLMDQNVGIVSMGGRAGTGKSALALCAGLENVLEFHRHKKIIVFRPLYAVGGQELGFLPGSEAEKMNPWAQAVFDTLGATVSENVVKEILESGKLEVLPLTHIRGRSLNDAFVIVDEAQSLERNVLLTVLSRIGQNSKVVLTHDVAQRDNLHVGRHDGVAAVVELLKGHPLFGHVTLTRSERSEIAALVSELLEEVEF